MYASFSMSLLVFVALWCVSQHLNFATVLSMICLAEKTMKFLTFYKKHNEIYEEY